ncbi:uncharacterized protein LOC125072804 [Vanessa atalanta]|uniref:uncharacterized protein LOC125072804 n=1 Tax=Vanessa atalanta TaxID=42275 RepID=UPI001FCE0204|nr:uncharacterized protein LOC125072804 [Vanessa atalanta]
MGPSCSCNDKWCNIILKLQNDAEKRKERRLGCTCISRRPRFLRFRRKLHRRKCTCIQLNKSTKYSRSPRKDLDEQPPKVHICSKHKNLAQIGCCSRGTDTCFFQSSDDEIQGYHNTETNSCCHRGTQNKNVCRFTVDAYFT